MHRDAKSKIIRIIEASQGLKAVELACKPEIAALSAEIDLVELLEELVENKEIVELVYVLPESNFNHGYLRKTFYLPKNTKIIMKDGK